MVNGRSKGASFELTIAKVLSEAMGIKLRRTPMSGGWSHDNPEVSGDLVCIEGAFPYCVECKNEEGWHLETLFTDHHQWFDNWWRQLMRECPEGKTPILVFSRARQPVFAAVKYASYWQGLSAKAHIILNVPDCILILLLEDLLPHLSSL